MVKKSKRPSRKSAAPRPGRPRHLPSDTLRRQVEMMAAFGNTEEQIAQILLVSQPTLRKHYRAELEIGHVKANNAVALNLFRIATTAGDPRSTQAAMFWLKSRAGWSEFAPAPPDKPLRPPGKKEAAARAAVDADSGTSWGEILH